jgi:TDG/mug DNA glycosylase family protein
VSAAAAAHFANPRNDFWRLLHEAGFTPRLIAPAEQFEVLRYGIGLTNAAPRTTPGSGDLRAADFAGAAERLERLCTELRPGAIGFVGKEAYRGTFRERPEHGLQERRLGETLLFVLPSTSPANAAVPYRERLRWFRALRGLVPSGRGDRRGVCHPVSETGGETIQGRFVHSASGVWLGSGGSDPVSETGGETIE